MLVMRLVQSLICFGTSYGKIRAVQVHSLHLWTRCQMLSPIYWYWWQPPRNGRLRAIALERWRTHPASEGTCNIPQMTVLLSRTSHCVATFVARRSLGATPGLGLPWEAPVRHRCDTPCSGFYTVSYEVAERWKHEIRSLGRSRVGINNSTERIMYNQN